MKKMFFGALVFLGGLFTALTIIATSFMKHGLVVSDRLDGIFAIALIFIIVGLSICGYEAHKSE
jgi:hypothetical protein